MPSTPATVTLDFTTLPNAATPALTEPAILLERYLATPQVIPWKAVIPIGFTPDLFGFQVIDEGVSSGPVVKNFTIAWASNTSLAPYTHWGTLTLTSAPSNSGRRLRVTILTKKVPIGGSLLTRKKKKTATKAPKRAKTNVKAKAKSKKKKSS